MELTYAWLTSPGPVRPNNEDFVGFWEPAEEDLRRSHGAVAVIADGVGGQDRGEVASQLSVETALRLFREAKENIPPRNVLWDVINAANLAVYDKGMDQRDWGHQRDRGRMATTLIVSVFRNTDVTIGHVGDSRAYLVQGGKARQITADHTYSAMQRNLGLISAQEAANSEMRSMLVRSVGREPTVQVDLHTVRVNQGDYIVQCTDGVHQFIAADEICEIVTHSAPEDACKQILALAEKRGTEDNLTVQVVRIDRVEEMMFYRGLPIYREVSQPMSHEVEVGQTLDGRFQITELISRSGMASIFKGIDTQTGETVALKVPFMQFESDPAFYSRFQREESIGRKLKHPYILRIIPVEEKSRPYIVMEFLQGQTLRSVMQSAERMPVKDALTIAGRICEALEYLHSQQVIHRDLKPENIMLCDDGSIRIMDFGIAKAAGLRRLTFAGFSTSMGTPDYMAPEQVKGKRGDARTDIYSLGVMLYEMVTGATPFEGNNPYAVMNARLIGDPIAPRKRLPELPPEVEEIILHALERQPFDRYPTAAAMKLELDAPEGVHVTGRSERLRPPSEWQGNWQNARLYVLATLVPILTIVILWLLFHKPR
jgi:serine/threonine protein phosphatase PrpC